MRLSKSLLLGLIWFSGLTNCPRTTAQGTARIKVAEGEYKVSVENDFGIGPNDTEVFHFRESWTLWRVSGGEYEVEGERTYESPRDYPRDERFIARLSHDLRLLKVTEFARLRFRQDSGPLVCELLPRDLRCSSNAKDPAHGVDANVPMDRPYALIWPLSAFSLGGLTHSASPDIGKPTVVQVVQLEELSDALPVLEARADGVIRYLGRSDVDFAVSGKSWHPDVYEVKSSPLRKLTLWVSPQGLLLAAAHPSLPNGKLQLVSFKQFADF